MKKRFLAMSLVGLMAVGLLAGCGSPAATDATDDAAETATDAGSASAEETTTPVVADGETYELDVAITFGEPATRNITAMLDAVTEASGGRVTFNVYPSNSLISIAEIPDALKDGVADIAVVPSVNYPSILTYNAELIGMPFIGIQDNDMACDAWEALYAEFPELQEEWDELGATVWYAYASPGYNLYSIDADSEIRTPSDLKGHKIMAGKSQWLDVVNANGGAGVQAAPTAYYENLEKGVSDGVIQSYSTIRTFGCLELINSGTEFSSSGSYYDMFFIAISNDTWNSLPEDIQQIFIDVANENDATTTENARAMEDLANAYAEQSEDMNTTVLTDDEMQVWEDEFTSYNETYLADLQETYKKDKSAEIYEFLLNWIAEQQ